MGFRDSREIFAHALDRLLSSPLAADGQVQAAMDRNKNPSSDGRVTAGCIWGPNDANTWIKTENTPLLYDTNHQPKLAYTTQTSKLPHSELGDEINKIGNDKHLEPN